jgi:hypothetical protein
MVLDILAFSLTQENTSRLNEAVKEIKNRHSKLIGTDDRTIIAALEQTVSGRGILPASKSGFQNLYNKIENWRDFLDEK